MTKNLKLSLHLSEKRAEEIEGRQVYVIPLQRAGSVQLHLRWVSLRLIQPTGCFSIEPV